MPRRSPQPRRSRARKPRQADAVGAPGSGFSTRQVADALGLPTARILRWVRRGLIRPERDPSGAYVFSFQDLVTLRTARELFEADVPTRKVHSALEALRSQLPVGSPLSAVTLSSIGDRVLVRDDDSTWEPDSGQLLMDLVEAPAQTPRETTALNVTVSKGTAAPTEADDDPTADDWYDAALDLEAESPDEAMVSYERAIALDPRHSDALLNLGRLHHEAGRLDRAEDCYRQAIEADVDNARALFNLGVVREDLGAEREAIASYERALEVEPTLAVAHFNLSRLHEQAGRRDEALQHLMAYRRSVGVGG